jgi:hypothetical protein
MTAVNVNKEPIKDSWPKFFHSLPSPLEVSGVVTIDSKGIAADAGSIAGRRRYKT